MCPILTLKFLITLTVLNSITILQNDICSCDSVWLNTVLNFDIYSNYMTLLRVALFTHKPISKETLHYMQYSWLEIWAKWTKMTFWFKETPLNFFFQKNNLSWLWNTLSSSIGFPIGVSLQFLTNAWLVLVQRPHFGDQVCHENVVCVFLNDSQQENTVVSQILVSKFLAQFFVSLGLQLVGNLKIFLYSHDTIASEDGSVCPGQKTEAGNYGNKNKPEPQECKNLLVEQVDRQDTLYCIVLEIQKRCV